MPLLQAVERSGGFDGGGSSAEVGHDLLILLAGECEFVVLLSHVTETRLENLRVL